MHERYDISSLFCCFEEDDVLVHLLYVPEVLSISTFLSKSAVDTKMYLKMCGFLLKV